MAITAGASRTDIDGLLKRKYLPIFTQSFSDKTPGEQWVRASKSYKFSGGTARFGVHTGRNTAIGSRGEQEELPSGGFQRTQQAEVTPVYTYGSINLTGPTIESGMTDADGFAQALRFEMKRLVEDISRYSNIKFYGMAPHATAALSLNGVMASVTSHDGTTGVVLKSPLGFRSGTDVPSVGGARYLSVNDKIVWGTGTELSTNAVPAGAFGTISSINYSTQTITLSATPAHSPAANDLVVLGHKVTSHEFNKCINGIGSLIMQNGAATVGIGASFEGISLTTGDFTQWATFKKDVAGSFNIDHLHALEQNLATYSGGNSNVLLADYSFAREYQTQLSADVRFEAEKLKGGYEMPTFMSMGKKFKFIFDQYCPYGMVFACDQDALFWIKMREMSWDETAKGILQQKQGYDDFYATMKSYTQLCMSNPNKHGALINITVSDTAL